MDWIIGKSYKTRNGNKMILVGNYRIANNQLIEYPLLFANEDNWFSTSLEGLRSMKEKDDFDIIGEWVE